MESKRLSNHNSMKEYCRSSSTRSSLDTIRSSYSNNNNNHLMMIKNIKPKVITDHHSSSPSWKVNNNTNNYNEAEEEAEDQEEEGEGEENYNIINGFSWPPRSYTCSFCKREFRSAQALGGHMNVHRKDRARLRQSPPRDIIHGGQYGITTTTAAAAVAALPPATTSTTAMFINLNPNPNPNPNPTFSSAISTSSRLPPLIPYTSPISSLCYSPFKCFAASSPNDENKKWQPILDYHADHHQAIGLDDDDDHHHSQIMASKGSDLAKMMNHKESVYGDYVRSGINECFVEKNMMMFHHHQNNLKKQVETTANSSTTVRLDLEIGVLGEPKMGSTLDLDLELRLGYS
ncbi:uncharacterized protein LOC133816560 [Humulus lupulus]|uniref:uncharacterized protein LOC133816560 n=1 Tax=Humulus lupulus TaxID=3486 RepID=UPI002B401032|nr:uncharacterized protein LOC133816560 [Humulus lupulus]